MTVKPSSWLALKNLPRYARDMILEADEKELIDVLAEIRATEVALSKERRLAMTEIEKGAEGYEFYVKQGRVANRSYNDSQLLLKVADALSKTPIEAIGFLLNRGILAFNWKWKPPKKGGLKDLIQELDLTITTVQHEIESGDEADIGEIWKDASPSFQLISEREKDAH